MRLHIPDDLADQFLPYLGTGTRTNAIAMEELMTRTLIKAVPLAEKGSFVVSAKGADLLGKILLTDHVGDEKVLVEATANLNDIRIGRHKVNLPAPVLKGLRDRADREGKEFGAFLQEVIDRLSQELGIYA